MGGSVKFKGTLNITGLHRIWTDKESLFSLHTADLYIIKGIHYDISSV